MAKRFLVTGGAGFIGSHVCEALTAAGAQIVVVDNLLAGSRENLKGSGPAVELIEEDIRTVDYRAIGEVDAVLHLAALISGYDSLKDPEPYINVNIGGTATLIEECRKLGNPRILFASSSTVYGRNAGRDLDEAVTPEPLSVYAMTKLAGEHLLQMYAQMHGFSHCSLRLFNVYGPRQDTNHPYANVTCRFSRAAAAGEPVELFGDGDQSRDFVYIDDVVACFIAALESSREVIYNVGTGRDRRIKDLLEILANITGKPLEVEPRRAWPNDIRAISGDTSRFRAEFGFAPTTGLDEGLARTVGYFREVLRIRAL